MLKKYFCLIIILFSLGLLSCNTYLLRQPLVAEYNSLNITVSQVQLGPDQFCKTTGYNQQTCYYPIDNAIGFAWAKVKVKNNDPAKKDINFKNFILMSQKYADTPQFLEGDGLLWREGWQFSLDPKEDMTRWLIFRYPKGARPNAIVFDKALIIEIPVEAKK